VSFSIHLYILSFQFTMTNMKVKVIIDEKPVELNSYVEMVFSKVINALISTLRGTEGWKKVRLDIES